MAVMLPEPTTTHSALFPTTDWGALQQQETGPWTEAQEEAMAHLFRAYAGPLRVFLLQRGRSVQDAEDLVQDFFGHAVSRGILRQVERRESRFRSFLLAVFTRWLTDQHRHRTAAKRGGELPHQPISTDTMSGLEIVEEGSDEAACQAYDREWAWAVVRCAMRNLRDTYEKRGRLPLFEALEGILPGGTQVRPYAEIAAALGMAESSVRKAAHQLRASCAEFLRTEVARTLAEPGMVDEELRYLLRLLRGDR